MNKSELIVAVAKNADISKKDAEKAVTALFDIIVDEVSEGNDIRIVGFGTFECRERKERTGCNPRTNEKITITYKENDKPGEPVEDTRCPVVMLDVIPKKVSPQTGENTILFVGLALVATASIAVVSKVKSRK